MAYVFLFLAVFGEVGATLSLKVAARGVRAMYLVVITGYIFAFAMLALAIQQGLALGVAYGIWAAMGVALTALLGKLIFKEPLTKIMLVGIALILAGILIIELGAQH